MNEPTQIYLANSLTVKQSTPDAAHQNIDLNGQTLNAKNIVFAKGSVQMDIMVNDHWQTLRLVTTQSPANAQKIAAADIQLNADGKQLTILPTQISLTLNQVKHLQNLLNFISTGNQLVNQPLTVNVITHPSTKLQLPQLNASLPINKEVANVLQGEQPLQAIINADYKGTKLTVINRFADNLHQQPISQSKLATWLAKLAPNGHIKANNNAVELTIPQQKSAFNIPLKISQAQQLSSTLHPVKITAQNENVLLKTHTPQAIVMLKNSLTQTFNSLLAAQPAKQEQQSHAQKQSVVSPLLNSNSPIKSWLQTSFADFKTRISDAVRYFEQKPFSKPEALLDNPHRQAKSINKTANAAQVPHTFKSLIPTSLSRINLAAIANSSINLAPFQANISNGTALPKHFHTSPPLAQFFQQIKAGLNALTTLQSSHFSTEYNSLANQLNQHKTETAPKTIQKQTSPIHISQSADTTKQADIKVQTVLTKESPLKNKMNDLAPTTQPPANKEITNKSIINNHKASPTLTPIVKNSATDISKIAEEIKPDLIQKAKTKGLQNQALNAPSPKMASSVIPTLPNAIKVFAGVHHSNTQKNDGTNSSVVDTKQVGPAYVKAPLSSPLVSGQISLPLEAKLLAPLLNIPKDVFKTETELFNQSKLLLTRESLTHKIEQLTQSKLSDNVDLNRLVNQAFNRMISSQTVQPLTVQREVLSILSPHSLSVSAFQNSFSQAIENLSVAILAAPVLNTSVFANFNSQTSLDALLQVLVPNFKAVNSEKLQEQLQQATSQTLATDLSQIKTTVSQVTSTPINQQTDNNAFVQFFLPMRLPPDASQTEISLGKYKKPSKDKPEGKDVWFVRLNFDYADLGQLQITAELMDKALDCKLLASSQEVTAMAHPHLESLRLKLSAHGLQVGELNLSQGVAQHHAFYQSHAIINIKV